MKNILIIMAGLFCFSLQAQYVISEQPVKGSIEVVSESQGDKISFPVLNTIYNRANPRDYKYHLVGEVGQKKAPELTIKKESVSQNFEGLDEFLKEEGYESVKELNRKNLAVYFVKK